MNDEKDIDYIKNLFKNKYGLILQKIPELSGISRTADLKCLIENKTFFVCELKTLENIIPSKATGYQGGIGNDFFYKDEKTGPHKTANLIKDAYGQLRHYDHPKMLILLNKNFDLERQDFLKAVDGYLPFKVPSNNIITRAYWWCDISEGKKIGQIKKLIDLYVWIDKRGLDQEKVFFYEKMTPQGESMYVKIKNGMQKIKFSSKQIN